jgi:glycosyltransferase involved in cell wall biosynthesis
VKFNSIWELLEIKSPDLPIVIPTFNNPTYLKNTVDYFLERNFNIIVLDNASTYPPMVKLLFDLSENDKCYIIMQNFNEGPRQFFYNQGFSDIAQHEVNYDWIYGL